MLTSLCANFKETESLFAKAERLLALSRYIQAGEQYYLAPAMVDLQVNGYDKITLDEGYSLEALLHMSESMRRDGTSQFAPTVITCSREYMSSVLEITERFMQAHPGRILGVHLEGPFISQGRSGIHPKELIRVMEPEDLEILLRYKDSIAYITCSPESVPGVMRKALSQAGIKLSLGHSTAMFAEADVFLKEAATLGTHLYNAMTKAGNGRNPGCAEALLLNRAYTGVICDGIHVAWPLVELSWRLLGERFVLVTDALAAAGIEHPEEFKSFKFAGKTIYNDPVKGCTDSNGTLGGSRLVMIKGVQNLVREIGMSIEDAMRTASINPCRALGFPLSSYVNILDKDLNIVEPCVKVSS